MKKFVNALTLIRMFATFVLPFIWNLLSPLALVIMVSLILLTDFFDGLLARTFKVQSLFGSISDTVADKLFGIVVLIMVARYNPLFYLIVLFEIIIAVVNIRAALLGATTKSTFLGKSKMWILSFATIFGIANIFSEEVLNITWLKDYNQLIVDNIDTIMLSTIFLTLGAQLMVATDYFRHSKKELKNKNEKVKYKFKDKESLKKVFFDTDFYLKNRNKPLSKLVLK